MELQKIGRYEIKAEIGRGGMATVYRAYDPRFERDVAIKVLPPQLLHEPTFRARFEREAKIIAALEHSGIVPVYDFGEEDEQPYLVMRLMPGGSLADRIAQGPLSLTEAARIISQIAPAIDYAHQKGIIHRDLKPGNILFDQQNSPQVSDFGIAKLTAASALTSSNTIIGTPAYMSPEQGRGDKNIDGRSDIYSLGAILFEMLSGRQPYEAETPTGQIIKHITEPIPNLLEFRSELPCSCQTVVERVMAKERESRYANVAEFAQAITAVADTEKLNDPIQMVPTPSSEESGLQPKDEPEPSPSKPDAANWLEKAPRGIRLPWWIAGIAAGLLCLGLAIAGIASIIMNLPGNKPTLLPTPSSVPTAMIDTPTVATSTSSPTTKPSSTATPKPTETKEFSPSPSPTSTAYPLVVVKVRSANIRYGPGTNYSILTATMQNEQLQVIGRNMDGSWLVVLVPGTDTSGWISISVIEVNTLIVDALPVVKAPPSPTPRPTQPPTEKSPENNNPPTFTPTVEIVIPTTEAPTPYP
jgi:serine/threonine-protein kinase